MLDSGWYEEWIVQLYQILGVGVWYSWYSWYSWYGWYR